MSPRSACRPHCSERCTPCKIVVVTGSPVRKKTGHLAERPLADEFAFLEIDFVLSEFLEAVGRYPQPLVVVHLHFEHGRVAVI
jgi:hypothetical protein